MAQIKKKILLFLNGESPQEDKIPDIKHYDEIICSDGAYHYVKELQLPLDRILGDLDSLNERPENIEIIELADQNFTDFDKILMYYQNSIGYCQFDIFGSGGKEHDHFLGNLSSAKRFMNEHSIRFYDNTQHFFLTESNLVFNIAKNKIVSLFPFPKAEIIRTEGLLYPADKMFFEIGKQVGTRNISISEQVTIQIKSGCLAIFMER